MRSIFLDPREGDKLLDMLEQMIQDKLIRQEAKRRGITVTKAEVDKAIQEAFGYFPNGTPTPEPTLEVQATSTLSPLQMTASAPLPSPTLTATLTPLKSGVV